MPVDHSAMKLGKGAPRRIDGLPMLSSYTMAADLPTPPAYCSWGPPLTKLGPMLNNDLGDCTCAAVGHTIQTWTANASKEVIPTNGEILALYENSCGYVPGNPATDQGGIIADVLAYWSKNPIADAGLEAFASINPSNEQAMRDGVYICGVVDVGIQLPLSAQNQSVWTVPVGGAVGRGKPGSWGGHSIPIIGFSPRGLLCITWGMKLWMTWDFWATYGDEAYALLGTEWVKASGQTPAGLLAAQLAADFKALPSL